MKTLLVTYRGSPLVAYEAAEVDAELEELRYDRDCLREELERLRIRLTCAEREIRWLTEDSKC